MVPQQSVVPQGLLQQVDVSKNRGKTPKWMVKIMENPIKIHDLGVQHPYFWKHPGVVETTKWAKMVDWELKMVALRGLDGFLFLLDVLHELFC